MIGIAISFFFLVVGLMIIAYKSEQGESSKMAKVLVVLSALNIMLDVANKPFEDNEDLIERISNQNSQQ